MINVNDVTHLYGRFEALYKVNLHISHNEFVFLVGPSGSGKSTLIRLLLREEIPSKGNIYVDKVNVRNFSELQVAKLRRNIGVVFQDYKLLPKRTVFENVAFPLHVYGEKKLLVQQKTEMALELVGLTRKLFHFPYQLSGGEQQRVSIARAIVNHPPILLADEPTGDLDPDTAWEIMELLTKINKKNTTVLVATHDKSIVDQMRKRVIAMEYGRVKRDQQLGAYSYGL
jgi:cell division transport system ATP-binding protein